LDAWAVAVYDFGLTEEQFLDLTPAKFRALSKRHELKNQLEDYRAGVIASLLYNIHRGKSAAKGPEAFFRSLAEEDEKGKKSEKDRGMSGQQMLIHMMNITLNKPVGL
jgi:hypothetical protein